MERIVQRYKGRDVHLVMTVKTVDWLVDNTDVEVFDPVTFEGYQRQIDAAHSEKLVSYLKDNSLLPASIICAVDGKYTEDARLRLVDGQHRVDAFRRVREEEPACYGDLRDVLMPVIVLENADLTTEVDTFITINKTPKKVDTSLAYVLKNKINSGAATSDDLSIPKRDYLAVELAVRLNDTEGAASLWKDRILFEGAVRNTPQTISLNAFVRGTRALIGALEKVGAISDAWQSREDIEQILRRLVAVEEEIWSAVARKWPSLFMGDPDRRRIIQGAIGYTAITRYVANRLTDAEAWEESDFRDWIMDIQIGETEWLPGSRYARYTSSSGYNLIAQELYDSTR